jgi:proteasome lid subunit RPN8/RPN11
MRLTRAVYHAIRAHGEQAWPRECCGALLGRCTVEGWQVEAAVGAENTPSGSAHSRYSIAPAELVRIEREARRRGLAIAGFYHSHPDCPAQWSPADLAEAHWLGCSYVITTVAQGKATITNSFLLAGLNEREKRFEQETVQVDEEGLRSSPGRSIHSGLCPASEVHPASEGYNRRSFDCGRRSDLRSG